MELKPGYKQTEVGVIPEDWEVSDLSTLTDANRPISYGIVQTGPKVQDGVRCLRVLDINNGRINTNDLITTTKQISDAYRRTVLLSGDLVMPLRGKVGEIALINNDLAGANLTRGLALIALRTAWSAAFCKQFISSSSTRIRLQHSMNGSALQEIPIATLRSFKIAIPPTKVEQEAIAEALDDADALIESLEQLIAKKRQIKQGAMQELLTGKKRLTGFSVEWTKKKLGSLGVFFKGIGIRKDESMNGNIPCIRYGEIYTRHYDCIRTFYSWISPSVAATARHLKCGDVLFAGSGETKEDIGKCVVFLDEFDAYAGGDIVILRPNYANSMFLGYLLNTPEINQQKSSKAQGDAIVHIGANALSDIDLTIPTIEEQTAIAKILSDMDAELDVLETNMAKACQLKQGMMHNLLTGKIRLR